MKKSMVWMLVLVLGISLNACKKEKNTEEKAGESTQETRGYQVIEAGSSMQWTAFKTTDKVPVKGTFKEVNITKSSVGTDQKAALDGLNFEIPVSSIFTNDSIRDGKLQKFFFAVMDNSMKLKGTFKMNSDQSGDLSIAMNGLEQRIPFEYSTAQDTIVVSAQMDLTKWNAQEALTSLNEACYELHKGSDGVSKTWNEVILSAKILTVKTE